MSFSSKINIDVDNDKVCLAAVKKGSSNDITLYITEAISKEELEGLKNDIENYLAALNEKPNIKLGFFVVSLGW